MPDVKANEREHPLYGENIDKWNLYYNSVKGGDSFINTDNIFSHRLEDTDDYNQRIDRGYYLNFCDTFPTIYNSYVFRNPVEREPDENIEAFRNNVDGKGTNMTDFIKRAGYLASIYGVAHIFVDVPETKKKNPSLADIKAEGIQPYCTIVTPPMLKDWSLDNFGNFRWVIMEYEYYRDLDPKVEREVETQYRVITTEEWYIENEEGESPDLEEEGAKTNGTNKLKVIPMLTLYHKNDDDDKIGESMLKDIVYINRIVMNWCSCIDEQIERQTFSQLIMPDDAEMDEDEERGANPLNRVGTSSIFTFNPESRHPPAFISPDTENINIIWKIVVDHIKEMFRLAGLQGGTSDIYTSKSGRQAQMGFKGVNASLAEKANTYQTLENSISRAVYLLTGKNVEDYEDVKYPTTFDVVDLEAEIDGYIKIMERNFSETLNKTMMKDISRRAIPLAPAGIRESVETEIDAGDGTVEPVSKTAIEPEKDGDGNPETSELGTSFKAKDVKDKEESSHRSEK